jgi:hypothetical protein
MIFHVFLTLFVTLIACFVTLIAWFCAIYRCPLYLTPACVPEWNARSEPRDQGRAASRWSGRHRSTYCFTCERTPSGRIRRSSSARRAFQSLQPCPSTRLTAGHCPGYPPSTQRSSSPVTMLVNDGFSPTCGLVARH